MSEMLTLQFGKAIGNAANNVGANFPRFISSGDQAQPKTFGASDNDPQRHAFFAESQELIGVLPS